MKQVKNHAMIIPLNTKPKPSQRELEVAEMLADFFKHNVYFVKPTITASTPDIRIGQQYWEIKSPLGHTKETIKHQFKRASRQCGNLALDLRQIKLHQSKAISYAKYNFKHSKTISNLIIVTKSKKILVFSKKT